MKLWVPQVKVSFKQIELWSSGQTAKKSVNKKAETKPAWYKRRKLWTIAGAAAAFIVLGILGWHILSSPGHGTVAVIATDTSPKTKLPEYTTLSTDYYTVDYSQRYTQEAGDLPPAGILDQKVLSYNLPGQPGESKIQIDIKAAPYGGITLDNTYDYYLKHPKQYKMSNEYYHGEAIDIARSQKGVAPEATGMWLHGSFLMIAKITTPDSNQSIDAELKNLLSSVQWRES